MQYRHLAARVLRIFSLSDHDMISGRVGQVDTHLLFTNFASQDPTLADHVDISAPEIRQVTATRRRYSYTRSLDLGENWLLFDVPLHCLNRFCQARSYACCMITTSQLAFDRCEVGKAIPNTLCCAWCKTNERATSMGYCVSLAP